MSLPIVMYGATDCDDTERTREYLRARGIPFHEVNIDHDTEAERFVMFINNGYRSTPTLVIGGGKRKIVLTEPTNEELEEAIRPSPPTPLP
ncbi:MAG TPA: glutaredoxin family protein [Anaerolineales bacterium]|nr:glutaredoxin family protein [Anaerolineales bacterium]